MNLKEEICATFCSGIFVSEFASGFGVSTQYVRATGDPLSFYILGPGDDGTYKIVDDALTVIDFESQGATLDNPTRREAFFSILREHDAEYDEDFGEVYIRSVQPSEVASKSIQFIYALLRLEDMQHTSRDKIRSTFYDDVEAGLRSMAGDRVTIESNKPVSEGLQEIVPDFVIRSRDSRAPVALFLVTGDNKLWQAIHLRMVADYESQEPVAVVAILEADASASQDVRRKADNRLDAVPRYRRDERDALARVIREATGQAAH